MSKLVNRAQLRGKALDDECYKARIATRLYGPEDRRIFCSGLQNLRTEDAEVKCVNCAAYVLNAQPPVEEEK